MKRIIGLISAAALLFAAASCQQEQLPAGNESGDVVTATFNVTIPDAMGTKAFGDGTTDIPSVEYEIWEQDNEGKYSKLVLNDRLTLTDNAATLNLKLIRFRTYAVFFWAENSTDEASRIHKKDADKGLQLMTINYTDPHAEIDAFAGRVLGLDASADMPAVDVELTRPFAQVNFATDDLNDANVTAGALDFQKAVITIPGLAAQYDAVNEIGTGDYAGEFTIEKTLTEATATADAAGVTFVANDNNTYEYVTRLYVLAKGTDKTTVDLKAAFTALRGEETTPIEVDWSDNSALKTVPIQKNYRTNFYGSLFTANGALNVSVDQEFVSTVNRDLDEAAKLSAVLADPTKSEYTLTSDLIIDEAIVLDRNFTLNLNGYTISNNEGIYNDNTNLPLAEQTWSLISVQAGNVTIEGAGTVAALEDDCFAIDVRNGANLTIKDGTYVGNLSAVYVHSGNVTIDGGTYSIQQLNTGYENVYCATLNCADEAYNNDNATIIVNGGSFLGYKPGESGLHEGKMAPEAKLGANAPEVVYNEETNYYTVGEEETPAEPKTVTSSELVAESTVDGLYSVSGTITDVAPSDVANHEVVTIDKNLVLTLPVPSAAGTLAVKSSTETYYQIGGTITVTVEKKDGKVAETAEVTAYEAPEATEPEPEVVLADGKYWISYDNMYAYPGTESSTFYYLQLEENGYIDNAFVFTSVDGGYTIQDSYGKYLHQLGTYTSFNASSTKPEAGAVWTIVKNDDGTFAISNGDYNVIYSANYSNISMSSSEAATSLSLLDAASATERPAATIVKTIEDGAYWIMAANKVGTPLTSTYGYINVVDAVDGASTADNAFTFTFVEGKGYTIADVNGKYYYQTGSYNNFNVTSTVSDDCYWTVEEVAAGTYKITNLSVKKYIQFTSSGKYGSYASDQTDAVLPTLVKATTTTGGADDNTGEEENEGNDTTPAFTGDGLTAETAYTIADAIAYYNAGMSNTELVWVKGVIAGTYSNNAFTSDLSSAVNTNLALGTESENMPLQLPSGDIRTALNLKDNPGNFGKTVAVKCKITKYFSVAGLKDTSEYKILD